MQEEQAKPKKGSLLLAEPYLGDPNFERSVVILLDHSETGSMGFVLSQPTGLWPSDVVSKFPPFLSEVFLGGPVEKDHLYFLHTRPDIFPDALQIGPYLYWGGAFEDLLTAVNSKTLAPEEIRFFIGYSGWGEGQLAEELAQGSWLVLEPGEWNPLDEDPATLWTEAMKKLGHDGSLWANAPEDPHLN